MQKLIPALLIFLFSSCAFIKETDDRHVEVMDATNYTKLNGRYLNSPTSTTGKSKSYLNGNAIIKESLWELLTMKSTKQGEVWDEQSVGLEFATDKKLIVTLYNRDTAARTKTIHGKIKKGYFYRRPFFIAIPFVPLFFGYDSERYRITLSDEMLSVDKRWNFNVIAIAAGNYGKGQKWSTFKKK